MTSCSNRVVSSKPDPTDGDHDAPSLGFKIKAISLGKEFAHVEQPVLTLTRELEVQGLEHTP